MKTTLFLAVALAAAGPAGACMEPPPAVIHSAQELDLAWGPCPAFLSAVIRGFSSRRAAWRGRPILPRSW